jgi:hypothetical protein
MISLLCPSRGRPKAAIDLYKSFIDTQKFKNEILFALQNDDEQLSVYIELFEKHSINYTVSESRPTTYLWNSLADIAKGDLLTLIGDDVIIETKNWDEIVETYASKISDKLFVITVNEGRTRKIDGRMTCPHPIVHKKWLETFGFFVPPFFQHRYIDTYLQNLAIAVDRFIEIPEVSFKHLKFNYWKDNTGQKSRKWLEYDKFIYENVSSRYFEKDLEVLRNKIFYK